MDGAAQRPVVGLLGAFDTGDLGEAALRRIVEKELVRRRPDIDVIAFSLFGAERPVPGDEGRPAHPLPPMAGAAELGLDALVIAGDVLAGDGYWSSRYPDADDVIASRGLTSLLLSGNGAGGPAAAQVFWFGVGAPGAAPVDVEALAGRDVWVRDRATQDRLGGTAVQSGDPMLLAHRVFDAEGLRRRADLLRMCGALTAGRRVVFDVTSGLGASAVHEQLVDAVHAALRADPKLAVIVVSLDPGARPPDAALQIDGLVAERVHHFPAWAGLDDVAAAMAGAAATIATSPAGAHLAAALGTPVAAIDTGLGARFAAGIEILDGSIAAGVQRVLAAGTVTDIGDAVHTLDGALTELAARLPRTATGTARSDLEPVDSALAILQQRLVDERTALEAELSRVRAELEHLQASPEHRLARPIREGYQRWQRRRT